MSEVDIIFIAPFSFFRKLSTKLYGFELLFFPFDSVELLTSELFFNDYKRIRLIHDLFFESFSLFRFIYVLSDQNGTTVANDCHIYDNVETKACDTHPASESFYMSKLIFKLASLHHKVVSQITIKQDCQLV